MTDVSNLVAQCPPFLGLSAMEPSSPCLSAKFCTSVQIWMRHFQYSMHEALQMKHLECMYVWACMYFVRWKCVLLDPALTFACV